MHECRQAPRTIAHSPMAAIDSNAVGGSVGDELQRLNAARTAAWEAFGRLSNHLRHVTRPVEASNDSPATGSSPWVGSELAARIKGEADELMQLTGALDNLNAHVDV